MEVELDCVSGGNKSAGRPSTKDNIALVIFGVFGNNFVDKCPGFAVVAADSEADTMTVLFGGVGGIIILNFAERTVVPAIVFEDTKVEIKIGVKADDRGIINLDVALLVEETSTTSLETLGVDTTVRAIILKAHGCFGHYGKTGSGGTPGFEVSRSNAPDLLLGVSETLATGKVFEGSREGASKTADKKEMRIVATSNEGGVGKVGDGEGSTGAKARGLAGGGTRTYANLVDSGSAREVTGAKGERDAGKEDERKNGEEGTVFFHLVFTMTRMGRTVK